MRVVLAAVRAAVRTIGTVRTIGAVRIRRALIGHITVGARLDAIRIHHRRGYHVQWMCGIAADPNGISNRQFLFGHTCLKTGQRDQVVHAVSPMDIQYLANRTKTVGR